MPGRRGFPGILKPPPPPELKELCLGGKAPAQPPPPPRIKGILPGGRCPGMLNHNHPSPEFKNSATPPPRQDSLNSEGGSCIWGFRGHFPPTQILKFGGGGVVFQDSGTLSPPAQFLKSGGGGEFLKLGADLSPPAARLFQQKCFCIQPAGERGVGTKSVARKALSCFSCPWPACPDICTNSSPAQGQAQCVKLADSLYIRRPLLLKGGGVREGRLQVQGWLVNDAWT